MAELDVDEIAEVNYLDSSGPEDAGKVRVVFKDGTEKIYEGPELAEIFKTLNHWTPPTA